MGDNSECRMGVDATISMYKKALQYSFDGIWILDPDGTVLFANDANERFHGHTGQYYIGKNIRELLSEGVLHKSAALRVFSSKKQSTVHLRQEGRHIFITSMPVFKEDGKLEMVISNTRDVTEIIAHGYKENVLPEEENYVSVQLDMGNDRENKEIVLASESSQKLYELIKKIARYSSTVHITGESGTGKEITARMLHALSEHAKEPFLGINCGAIPPNLLESEMFGYEAGAFTGATGCKPGLFELVGRGTILLDEVGTLPLDMQSKLLRAIQEKQYMRVGGLKTRPIQARILSASNEDIFALVGAGRFREDLYYRLNVIKLVVPPLRLRKDDIPHIVFNKMSMLNDRYKSSKAITPDTLHRLISYHWPGNIRELENVVEGMYVVSDNLLDISSVPQEIHSGRAPAGMQLGRSLKDLMEAYEAEVIKLSLKEWRTVKATAKHLNVDYTTLWRKIRKYLPDVEEKE